MAARHSGDTTPCVDFDFNADLLDSAVANVEIVTNGQLELTLIDGSTVINNIPLFQDFNISITLTLDDPNFEIDYTAGDYQLDGVVYTLTPGGSLSIPASDPTDPRIDIIYVDNTSNIFYLAGTPSPTPVAPTTPVGALKLAEVGVLAGASAGSGGVSLTLVNIFENLLNAGFIDGQVPVWDNTFHKYLPQTLAGLLIPTGTVDGSILKWSGTSWIETINVLVDNIGFGSASMDGTSTNCGIFAGNNNIIDNGCDVSTIIGGDTNKIDTSTTNSSIIGGTNNNIGVGTACDYSIILGSKDSSINFSSQGLLGNCDNSSIYDISEGSILSSGACEIHDNSLGGVLVSESCIISDNSFGAVIISQSCNITQGSFSAIIGASNSNITNNTDASVIVGGISMLITNSSNSTLLGGTLNNVKNSLECSVIGGNTSVIDTSSSNAVIVGGTINNILTGDNSIIVGGINNTLDTTTNSILVGGNTNEINGTATNTAIIGGLNNIVVASDNTTIIGGNAITTTKDNTTYIGQGQVHKYKLATGATYVLLNSDYIVEIQTGTTTAITLLATPETGRTYRLKKVGAANVTITPAAGNIEGAANYVLGGTNTAIEIFYNGTQWLLM